MVRRLAFVMAGLCVVAGSHVRADGEKGVASIEVGQPLRRLIEADWIERDEWYKGPEESAPPEAVHALGVTTQDDAAGGCDGIKNGRNGFHTASGEVDPWWQVDLGQTVLLDRVVIFNRTDGNTASRTRKIRVLVAVDGKSPEFELAYQHNGETFYGVKDGPPLVVDLRGRNVTARIVRLHVPGRCSFALDEVEVYAAADPQTNIALGRPADQKSLSSYSKASPKRPRPEESASQPPRSGGTFALAHTREVIERAGALASRLRSLGAAEALDQVRSGRGSILADLASLEERLAALDGRSDVSQNERKAIYLASCRVARRIAFCNPLLDFEKILFIKRHHPGGLYHMVHQYYGFCATPGGGLYVLDDPFSDNPRLSNLLDGQLVTKGRLEGKPLTPGSFLSPELSYDGKRILFAYSECQAEGIEWTPRASYHLFRMNLDGSELVQMSDGRWNDFDPCYLPNGRIVFISERRGGYLRCGGSAPPYDSPTYTLHSMSEDGDDVVCLSFHETQEWHPSVTNDGRIVYTRWDYVDRDTNVAHHLWTCYADGRDPRSFHGNYPTRRESRPWMEMSIRAVPQSQKFVATAAAHHGHAFGSLVLIDPQIVDDGAMSQLTRLTPDVPFPESEGGKAHIREQMVYGTAWPLSEDDMLCVYDRRAKNHGIYWIDRFGNKELIYRDAEIPCLSPIPLRSRLKPPTVPDLTFPAMALSSEAAVQSASATVAVANVYESDFEWPQNTRVAALRIIHVLPKTTAPSNKPRIGVANQTNARAVLGTVPVEDDGSAYFEVPAGKTVFFQAIDEEGLAVQSMRSGTYLHPGEQLTCHGCHEPKWKAPEVSSAVPLALQRLPSKIQPDVSGSNPFNYVRLVQPVLDRHCVACHEEKKAIDLAGSVADEHGWTTSYANLAADYGFYFHVSNGSINSGAHGGSRTVPGQFGARAALLLKYLDQGHYGVQLSEEEFHRVTLWLDCNSEFYGAYERTAAQSQGEVVYPSMD